MKTVSVIALALCFLCLAPSQANEEAEANAAASASVPASFHITPSDPPNQGILFVDHSQNNRSGHLGHALVEYEDGKILAFYPNCSDANEGHSGEGWMEYKRSIDGGKTWSAPLVEPNSRALFDDGDGGNRAALCEKAILADNGDIVLFYLTIDNREQKYWRPQFEPMFARSTDGGQTWSKANQLSPDAGRVYGAVKHRGEIFALHFAYDCEIGFVGRRKDHVYQIHVSSDQGKTFSRRSILPFDGIKRGYGTIGELPSGELIAYVENMMNDPYGFLEYSTSTDRGRTWSAVKQIKFAKQIRNPQFIQIDGTCFMHGRLKGGHFGLYSSKDGLKWDDGIVLRKSQAGAGAYSNSIVVGALNPNKKDRLLIQASHAYRKHRTNVLHWWLETPAKAVDTE